MTLIFLLAACTDDPRPAPPVQWHAHNRAVPSNQGATWSVEVHDGVYWNCPRYVDMPAEPGLNCIRAK